VIRLSIFHRTMRKKRISNIRTCSILRKILGILGGFDSGFTLWAGRCIILGRRSETKYYIQTQYQISNLYWISNYSLKLFEPIWIDCKIPVLIQAGLYKTWYQVAKSTSAWRHIWFLIRGTFFQDYMRIPNSAIKYAS